MKRAERVKQWVKYIAGWKSSGLTQRRYCEQKAIAYDTFKRWRLRLREDASSEAPKLRLVPMRIGVRRPVDVEAMPSARQAGRAPLARGVEIRLSSARSIVLGGELDEVALARLIRLLEVLPC